MCPHCNEKSVIKYGKFNGIQRYKCKYCNKTYSDVTNTFFYWSKKSKILLKDYTKLMHENKNLRIIATMMEITLVTSFKWRHKIINIFKESNEKHRLQGIVESVTHYFKENFKGQRNLENKERQRVQALVAYDSDRRTNPIILAIGTPRMRIVNEKLNKILDEKSIFFPIGNRFLNQYKKIHNKGDNLEEKNDFKKDGISVKTRKWFIKFRGVATKYLEEYLSWFMVAYKRNKIRFNPYLIFQTTYSRAREFI